MRRFIAALFSVLLLTAFLDGTSSQVFAEGKSLKDWEGTWNSFSTYFDEPELEKAYQIKAGREGKSADDVRGYYVKGNTYRCDIKAMGIKGDKVVFYNKAQQGSSPDGDAAVTAKYKPAGEIRDNFNRAWWHFEAVGTAPYKHLFLSQPETDEPGKTMRHFHFRYGDNIEAMKNAKGWFPTMTPFNSAVSLVAAHIAY